MERLYNLNKFTILPETTTSINTRSQCEITYKDNYLPLFTAPMTGVVNNVNWREFANKQIHAMLPRSMNMNWRLWFMHDCWIAMGLEEVRKYFLDTSLTLNKDAYLCIDVANGHMKKLHDMALELKERYGNKLHLMIGNIASPQTYDYLCKHKICDYVRVGIGGGSCCITSKKTGVHYPMGSLLKECNEIKKQYGEETIKIVADGGFDGVDKIVKALALGADYVMCGKLFMECEEACAPMDENHTRLMYGMSTYIAQREFGNKTLKPEEGIELEIKVDKTLDTLLTNFTSALKSAMSYTNSLTLKDFIGNVQIAIID